MKDSGNISQYRSRLDQTLSSHDLVDYDKLKTIVKNQILSSSECDLREYSENLVDRRTKEVANFLSMLRSASVTDSETSNGGWKVKQDSEEIRVMYREGSEGTPYHTLLAEGYVDGPIDVCLCISWEAELYKKWWPQTTIPTFKIAACECLQKDRTGEQICLVRMKLSRPLSAREAVVHLFAFEYFQDGLIVVVANSISDLDNVDRSTHGYSKDGIPHVQDVLRVDLVGGFALQKVTNNRSYFRWPQTTIPTFKIAACECLQKDRTGEQICLVRMKLSRPLSAREAVVHLFAFEYFQDGLIVVVANSISDLDNVDRSTHGYSKDGIPHVQDVLRVDLVGGFAIQKVTNNRSYFRTIGNLDINLDFIPPALTNFVSRQLIGGGFKLYKKEVALVAKGDEDFSKALKDPMYARIREALYSDEKIPNSYITLELQVPLDEETRRNNDEKCPEPKVHRDNCVFNIPGQGNFEVRDKNIHSEVEEIEDENCEKIECLDEDDRKVRDFPVNQLVQKPTKNKNVGISPEVKQALGTLDKAISIIREYRCNLDIRTVPHSNIMSVEAETDSLQDSKSSEADKDRRNVGDFGEVSHEHRNNSCCRRTSSSLCTREAHHNKIALASPDAYATIPDEAHTDQETIGTIMEGISKDDNVTVANEMSSMRRSSVKEKLEN